MGVVISLYSDKENEIKKFLDAFYEKNVKIAEDFTWDYCFKNPVDSADIIGVYIDNKDKFKINMWISFDKGFFINVTENNVNKIIKYLFERYPY